MRLKKQALIAIREMTRTWPENQKLIVGAGVLFLGYVFLPKKFGFLVNDLLPAVLEKTAPSIPWDAHQLGRSEVVRELARGHPN